MPKRGHSKIGLKRFPKFAPVKLPTRRYKRSKIAREEEEEPPTIVKEEKETKPPQESPKRIVPRRSDVLSSSFIPFLDTVILPDLVDVVAEYVSEQRPNGVVVEYIGSIFLGRIFPLPGSADDWVILRVTEVVQSLRGHLSVAGKQALCAASFFEVPDGELEKLTITDSNFVYSPWIAEQNAGGCASLTISPGWFRAPFVENGQINLPGGYAGDFDVLDGRPHGRGSLPVTGGLYVGEFCNGKFHGFGKLEVDSKGGSPNTSVTQIGEFSDGHFLKGEIIDIEKGEPSESFTSLHVSVGYFREEPLQWWKHNPPFGFNSFSVHLIFRNPVEDYTSPIEATITDSLGDKKLLTDIERWGTSLSADAKQYLLRQLPWIKVKDLYR